MREYAKRLRRKARFSQPAGTPDPAPETETAPAPAPAPALAPWRNDWRVVEQRLDDIADESFERVVPFVTDVLETTRSPIVIVALARHPRSMDTTRSWLQSLCSEPSDLEARVTSGEVVAAALSAAARLLLPPADAEETLRVIQKHLPRLSSRYFQFLDSWVGFRPAGGAPTTAHTSTVRHRLIIADQLYDPRKAALLLPGCDRATLFSTADIFGRADFSDRIAWTESGEVTIEHIRSRVTRYSTEYIGLHEATARIGEQVAARVAEIPGLVHADDQPFVAVDVADFLFFRALRLHAIEVLLDDQHFDHIVVAVAEHSPKDEFLQLLGGVQRLRTDPRVEIVSVARTKEHRAGFWKALDAITEPPRLDANPPNRFPIDTVVRQFNALAATQAVTVEPDADEWVLLATTTTAAYNDSTAACAREIAKGHPLRVLHMQQNDIPIDEGLAALDDDDRITFATYASGPVRGTPLADLARTHLQPSCVDLLEGAGTTFERAAAHALYGSLAALVSTVVVPALLRPKILQNVFESWRQESRLPAAVVLIPQRNAGVGVVAAVARRMGVPSIAVEPHLYVPEYSRYNKIAADYYGVLSTYLVAGAVEHFGLNTPDRVRVIGSPRLVAPADYEPAVAQLQARTKYAAEYDFDFSLSPCHMVFFCQPSGWRHVAPIWEMLLDAIESSGTHLFFKPHQEEGPARVLQYENHAVRRGLSHRVTRLGGDAADAVGLADIVGTAYSTAALDAAIRAKPVVCVAPGGVPYPVDTAAIAGARVTCTADELAACLSDFIRDPSSMQDDARAWIERERQFIEGPGPALRRLVVDAIEQGARGLRTPEELPPSLFTDGPHPVFRV